MSSFFTLPPSQRKRKRADDRPGKAAKRRGVQSDGNKRATVNGKNTKAREAEREDSISGSESEEDIEAESAEESEATSEEEENAADRRIRLAQRYLDNLKDEVEETGFDAEDVDRDLLAARLKEDVDEANGRRYRLIATSLDYSSASQFAFRTNAQATTAVATCPPSHIL